MMDCSILPQPSTPEGRSLREPVPLDFERFYRAQLRFCPGQRIRSSELARRYKAWAAKSGAAQLGHRAIRRAMLSIGHQHARSDGMVFRHVEFAEAAPDLADNFPAVPRELLIAEITSLAERFSTFAAAAVADLAALRAHVAQTSQSKGAR
jgi:hypothetical protein